MIQPRDTAEPPALFAVGCVGRIIDVEAHPDGRFDIVLEGVSRFRILRELDVTTPFRQVEAELEPEPPEIALSIAERAALEQESKRFAEARGYMVDWESVARLDDESLVNGIAQVAPFDVAAKQALLESDTLSERAALLLQLMHFGRYGDEDGMTLQ